jgi:hypothetical protein
MKAERVVNELKRELVDGSRIGAARSSGKLGGLPIRQEDLRSIGKGALAVKKPLLAIGFGAIEEIVPFVGSAHAAQPSPSVSYSRHADDAFDTRIDRPNPNHCRAAVAGAVDSETIGIDARLETEKH